MFVYHLKLNNNFQTKNMFKNMYNINTYNIIMQKKEEKISHHGI